MKAIKVIFALLEGLCAIGILWGIYRLCFNGGTSASDILSAVELDLPKYEIISKDDNQGRGASRWDWYQYRVSFSPKDADSLLENLNEDGWENKDGVYYKNVQNDEDLIYSARIMPSKGAATLEVEIDELYSLGDCFIIFGWIVLASFSAFLFGIIWLVKRKFK